MQTRFRDLLMKKLLLLIFAPIYCFATVSNGPYVGLEAGVANQITVFNANTPYNSSASNAYSPNLGFLGRLNLGYNLTKYSGFELGGTYNFGAGFNYPDGNGSMNINATTVDLSYLFYLPTSFEGVSVFARVGGAYDWINSTSSNGCNCGSDISGNSSGGGFADVLGAGVKYNITSKTSFRVEWLANGLFFPIGINNGSIPTANWTNQTFILGVNLHF